MSTRGHTRQRRLLAAMVGLGLVVAACGSDDGGDSGDDAAPATTAAATDDTASDDTTADDGSADDTAVDDTTADDGGSADGLALATERVDAFSQPVAELPLTTPFAVEPGAKVFYVQCGVSACSEIAVGVEAAAEAAGWEYETASHQDTPDTVASAFDAAIAAQPDVVLTSGNPREWFESQLATLEEQGIPVVACVAPRALRAR